MRIDVGPARRLGNSSGIYDRPLEKADLEVGHDGNVVLTINASGMNCRKSLYRYKIHLSQREVDYMGLTSAKS